METNRLMAFLSGFARALAEHRLAASDLLRAHYESRNQVLEARTPKAELARETLGELKSALADWQRSNASQVLVARDLCIFFSNQPAGSLIGRLADLDSGDPAEAVHELLREALGACRIQLPPTAQESTTSAEPATESTPAIPDPVESRKPAASVLAPEEMLPWGMSIWLVPVICALLLGLLVWSWHRNGGFDALLARLASPVREESQWRVDFLTGDLASRFEESPDAAYELHEPGSTDPRAIARLPETLPLTVSAPPADGTFLRCKLGSRELDFPFTAASDPETPRTLFQAAIGADWELAEAGLELLVEDPEDLARPASREPGGFDRGDQIHVMDCRGKLLARAHCLESSSTILLPISRPADFSYRFVRAQSPVPGERLAFDPTSRVLTCKSRRRRNAPLRAFDELTGTELKAGRPIVGIDPITRERRAAGYLPAPGEPDYFLAPLEPGSGFARLRPVSVACKVRCFDLLTRKPVKDFRVQASGGVTYVDGTRQLVLAPPSEIPDLGAARLLVEAEGYEPVRLTLQSAGRKYPASGELAVSLKRRHHNITVLFPASVGMGVALGKHSYSAPGIFFRSLESALRTRCASLGYEDIQFLLMKDQGLEEMRANSAWTFKAADRPEAIFTRVREGRNPDIFEDSRLKGRVGKHSILVVVLGDFYPPAGEAGAKGAVMHLHIAKLWQKTDRDPFVERYCAENADGVTHLVAGNPAAMEENAKVLAAEIETHIRNRLYK